MIHTYSSFLQKNISTQESRLVFMAGGPESFSDSVKDDAKQKLVETKNSENVIKLTEEEKEGRQKKLKALKAIKDPSDAVKNAIAHTEKEIETGKIILEKTAEEKSVIDKKFTEISDLLSGGNNAQSVIKKSLEGNSEKILNREYFDKNNDGLGHHEFNMYKKYLISVIPLIHKNPDISKEEIAKLRTSGLTKKVADTVGKDNDKDQNLEKRIVTIKKLQEVRKKVESGNYFNAEDYKGLRGNIDTVIAELQADKPDLSKKITTKFEEWENGEMDFQYISDTISYEEFIARVTNDSALRFSSLEKKSSEKMKRLNTFAKALEKKYSGGEHKPDFISLFKNIEKGDINSAQNNIQTILENQESIWKGEYDTADVMKIFTKGGGLNSDKKLFEALRSADLFESAGEKAREMVQENLETKKGEFKTSLDKKIMELKKDTEQKEKANIAADNMIATLKSLGRYEEATALADGKKGLVEGILSKIVFKEAFDGTIKDFRDKNKDLPKGIVDEYNDMLDVGDEWLNWSDATKNELGQMIAEELVLAALIFAGGAGIALRAAKVAKKAAKAAARATKTEKAAELQKIRDLGRDVQKAKKEFDSISDTSTAVKESKNLKKAQDALKNAKNLYREKYPKPKEAKLSTQQQRELSVVKQKKKKYEDAKKAWEGEKIFGRVAKRQTELNAAKKDYLSAARAYRSKKYPAPKPQSVKKQTGKFESGKLENLKPLPKTSPVNAKKLKFKATPVATKVVKQKPKTATKTAVVTGATGSNKFRNSVRAAKDLIKNNPKTAAATAVAGIGATQLAAKEKPKVNTAKDEKVSPSKRLELTKATTQEEIKNHISKMIKLGKLNKYMIKNMMKSYNNKSKEDSNWRQFNPVVADLINANVSSSDKFAKDFAKKFQKAIGHNQDDGKIGPKTLKSLLDNWDTLKV